MRLRDATYALELGRVVDLRSGDFFRYRDSGRLKTRFSGGRVEFTEVNLLIDLRILEI